MKHSKEIKPIYDKKRSEEFLKLSRLQPSQTTMFITGHRPFKRLLWKMNQVMILNVDCTTAEQETAEHILCDCVALSIKIDNLFGKDSMELAQFTDVELSKILNLTNFFDSR